MENDFLSTPQAAKLLKISRVAVFKKIKSGEIKARKIGRNFVIKKSDISIPNDGKLNEKEKKLITRAVSKTIHNYSETLRLLGKE